MALVGQRNNQSVLDDDASLFQEQQEKTEKEKWTELSLAQRLRYFIDYYLLKCFICIIIIAITVIITWSILKPQKEKQLFIAIVQNNLVPEEKELLEQQLTNMFVTDTEKEEIRIDDTFPNGYESDAKLSAYLSAQEIDLIITNEERFQQLAKTGCYEDLNEFLPDIAADYKDSLCWTNGYSETESETINDIDSNNTETDIIKAYGIDITDCEFCRNTWYANEKAIIGIVSNSLHKENAKKAIKDLFLTTK